MVQKKVLFFLSRAPTHDSFAFDSRFLYDYHFRFRFAFNKVFFFFSTRSMDSSTLKRHNSVQN